MKKAAALVTGEEFVEGAVESIVFYNPDNGYTVARFQPESGEPMTVVGCFPPLSPGEVLRVYGDWTLSPRFGRQFKVDRFTMTLPASAKGIEKFLASGLVKGIGPVLAARIVAAFGIGTIDILTGDAGPAPRGRRRRRRQAQGDQALLERTPGHPRPDHVPPGPRRDDGAGHQDLQAVRRTVDLGRPVESLPAQPRHLRRGLQDRRPARPQARDGPGLARAGQGLYPLYTRKGQRAGPRVLLRRGRRRTRGRRPGGRRRQGRDRPGRAGQGRQDRRRGRGRRPRPLPAFLPPGAGGGRPVHPQAGRFPLQGPGHRSRQGRRRDREGPGHGVLAAPAPGRSGRASSARSWSSPAGPGRARRPSSGASSTSSANGARRSCWPPRRAARPRGSPRRRARRPGRSTASSSSSPRRGPSSATSPIPSAARPWSSTNSRWSTCRSCTTCSRPSRPG